MPCIVQTSTLFCVAGLGLAQASPFVKIVYPWSAGAADQPFSGIPPHVAVLHEIQSLRCQQDGLVENFCATLTQQLDERQFNGGATTEA